MNDLRDQPAISSVFEGRSPMELRLLYSIAVIRAVNGLVDTRQQSYYAESVLSIATNMGIASWIVELRHDSTHNELPSLSTLRDACDHLLNWLQCKYWSQQSDYLSSIETSSTVNADSDCDDGINSNFISSAEPVLSTLGIRAIITNFLRDSTYVEDADFESFYSEKSSLTSADFLPSVAIPLLVNAKAFTSNITSRGNIDDTDIWTCFLCVASIVLIDYGKESSKHSDFRSFSFLGVQNITKLQNLLWPIFVLVSFICHLHAFLKVKTIVHQPLLRERLLRAIWEDSDSTSHIDSKLLELLKRVLTSFFIDYRISIEADHSVEVATGAMISSSGSKRNFLDEGDLSSQKYNRNNIEKVQSKTCDHEDMDASPVLKQSKRLLANRDDSYSSHYSNNDLTMGAIWPLGSMPGHPPDSILLHRIEFDI